ncbi:uncharacterized protein G2W53_044628 [Senna tora]|uniref:Uncharacterized protein n=1 Tax=Senna tora TaxID=362788 RepID=A0A834SNH6_9FABA|nr:uncharacterized protein G2W53_044628 [Senna tora]
MGKHASWGEGGACMAHDLQSLNYSYPPKELISLLTPPHEMISAGT